MGGSFAFAVNEKRLRKWGEYDRINANIYKKDMNIEIGKGSMNKTRILHFTIGNVMGGVTQYVLNLWENINKEEFQFDFVTMSKKLDFEKELTDAGCKVFYLSCYAEANREQFIKEMREILEQGYQVIHLHTNWWRSFLVEELATEYKVPRIIVHSHNTRVGITDDEKRAEETRVHLLRRDEISPAVATDFWACSHTAAEWLFGKNVPKDQIVIMNNAIDVERFRYNEHIRENIRFQLNIQDKFVIGHVGRFAYQKNHEFLLRVFMKICEVRKDACLLLIGVGELENTIREMVQQAGIEHQVKFLGKRTDVNELYQAMDLFLLPSRFEGLPITLVEAQTAGLKCLCSDAITKETKISDNLEYLPFEESLWKEKILRLMVPYRREDMRQIVADAGYSIQSQIKIIEKEYRASGLENVNG